MPPDMADVIKREGVAESARTGLIQAFAPFHQQITTALEAARGVTDGANPSHQKVARACRLELRRVRCKVEDARKAAKADALRYGKAVDGLANVLKFLCEPEEERLDAIEKHAERIEAARVAQLVADRTAALVDVGVDPAIYNLATMDDATFDAAVETAKRMIAERQEAERRAEAERVQREKAEAEERARQRAENDRLRAEAEAREAAIAAERRAAAEELARIESERQKERQAVEKAQAEARARAEAERAQIEAERRREREKAEAALKAEREARAIAEFNAAAVREHAEAEAKAKAEAERRAAQAPDREKIEAFATAVYAMEMPAMSTELGSQMANEIRDRVVALAEWVYQKSTEL
jgi:hypothetical protein